MKLEKGKAYQHYCCSLIPLVVCILHRLSQLSVTGSLSWQQFTTPPGTVLKEGPHT